MAESGGWVKQTVPFSLLMIGAGLFIVGYGTYIARMAWTKNAEEYLAWFRQLRKTDRDSFWMAVIPRWYPVWNDRILSIVGVIMGVFVALVGAYSLWRNIVGE